MGEKQERILAFYFTNTGGMRPNNEDGLLVQEILISDRSMESPGTLEIPFADTFFCVADGIGGEQRGEIASRMVLRSLRDHASAITDEPSLLNALKEAKSDLDRYGTDHPESFNLGCTMSGVILRGPQIITFNIGDCRVYRLNGKFFQRVTKDHSIVQSLFEDGVITEEDMRHHPKRNIVTSSISGDGKPDSVEVFSTILNRREKETLFLCSDGVWGCFAHEELEMIYEKFHGIEFCEKLLTASLARRVSDNISVIILNIFPAE
ncbi:MAG TPA: protein phosphatase 2C domain-containing protein [Methanospirillum sp.]|nr:protein phosphatase 2C domain-containing protein [Methanospirillum sp.]